MNPVPRPRTALAAIALVSTVLLLPGAAGAETPTWQEEVALEQSCEEWQKVRRCQDENGEIGLECASKSPFARFLSMFRSRGTDDEVHVEVVRKGPGQPTAHAERAESSAEAAREDDEVRTESAERRVVERRADTRVVEGSADRSNQKLKRVRTSGDLPRCESGR